MRSHNGLSADIPTLIVLTSYPEPGQDINGRQTLNAIAQHARRVIPYLAKQRAVLIISETTGHRSSSRPSQMVRVDAVWSRGRSISMLKVLKTMLSARMAKTILVQFEFNLLGGIHMNLLLLLLL